MADDPLSLDEVERLAHYDLMAHLESPCFVIGGLESSDRLANMCAVAAGQQVLFVGCGTGESARHWARRYGIAATGIDSSARMIDRARERLARDPAEPRATFDRGCAYALDLREASFDVVVTEFVAGLLDFPRALAEIRRVLKPRGRLGINELAHDDDAPPGVLVEIDRAVQDLRRIIGLPFSIPRCSAWSRSLRDAGFEQLATESFPLTDYARRLRLEPERRRALDRMRGAMGRYARASARIRRRLEEMGTVERRLFSDVAVARHLRYVLIAGTRS